MTRLIFALLVSFLLILPAQAETKAEKAHELVVLSGTADQMNRVIDLLWPQLASIITKSNPKIPSEVLEEIKSVGIDEFKKSIPEIAQEYEKLYEINYSDEEIDALLTFYRSPLGHSAMSKMGTIAAQGAKLGQVWGAEVGKKVTARLIEELRNKGYKVDL